MTDVEPGALPRRVLVISYSQSGQLDAIVSALVTPFKEAGIAVAHAVLWPVPPFPFPWSAFRFLDVFPESFQEIPCRLEPLPAADGDDFDLILIAYQVWYLSPSRPISSFLQHPDARRLLRDRPVLTVVGARNMWYRAHERIKQHLRASGARLIGHIALTDRAFNLVSVITIVYWMLSGRKQRLLGLFPKPGIDEKDIARCAAWAAIVGEALSHGRVAEVQARLNEAGACRIVPHLMALESAASRAFRAWSALILRAKTPRSRGILVRTFGFYLACGIALLSPVLFLLFYLTLPLRRAAVQRQVDQVHRP
jgi:hypothetical protein